MKTHTVRECPNNIQDPAMTAIGAAVNRLLGSVQLGVGVTLNIRVTDNGSALDFGYRRDEGSTEGDWQGRTLDLSSVSGICERCGENGGAA